MHFGNKVLEHFFGDLKVGDHAILERPDRLNVARRASEHPLRLFTHRFN